MEGAHNEVNGIEIDRDNLPFLHAAKAVLAGKNVFLTGEAGTGKTTFLHFIRAKLEKAKKPFVIIAPTGVAAVNAHGQTIHSFFRLPFGPLIMSDPRFAVSKEEGATDEYNIYETFKFNKWQRELIESLETVVIDEISMVRSDVLQAIDRVLRVFRKRSSKPFGGVQMVLIGDAYQLPPVLKQEEETILRQFYPTRFFFGSRAWADGRFEGYSLAKIYRQQDPFFIQLLNRIRQGNLTIADQRRLQARRQLPSNLDGFVNIVTHKRIAQAINDRELHKIPGLAATFRAKITGKFPESSYPMDIAVDLKIGAQVMVTRSDFNRKIYNGTMATVERIDEGCVTIAIEEQGGDGLRLLSVEPVQWEHVRYKLDTNRKKVEREVLGTFTQLPLTLAWAITIHKSQGLTFDKVIADVGQSFAYGQEYVALSRCRSFENLYLTSDLKPGRLGPHPRVERFYGRMFGAA